MNAHDTNVWIYCHDTRDSGKQSVAQQVIATMRPYALIWQVGCEFIAGCRKLSPLGFSEKQAWDALADMQAFAAEIVLPDPLLWPKARDLQNRYLLSFWDALLVAACLRGGVQTLYTENMGAPRVLDSLSLVNPFLAGP